jgi:ResB-like family
MARPRDDHDYVGDAPAKAPAKGGGLSARTVLLPLASLRLTVVLFVLALVIVFFGTLAQKRLSLNTVLEEYFYTWIAWVDLNLISEFTQVFLRFRLMGTEEDPVRVPIPFPGGFTIGWLMVINLTAAHLVRFKLTWKRLGIWVLHAGVIVLLAGEFIRANWAVEDRMNIREGQSANFLFSLDHSELAFMRKTADGADEVISVPGELLTTAGGSAVSPPDLPFDLEVVKYMRHTGPPTPVQFGKENPADAGIGKVVTLPEEKEVSSIKGGGKINTPGLFVRLTDRATGKSLGTYLFGVEFPDPQIIPHAGEEWRVAFRLQRTYLPYTVHAVKVERVNWPDTEKPKEFKSVVRLENPTTQETREVLIEMNEPLRYQGRTFYQSQMDTTRGGNITGFQVVKNPGAHVPYVACTLIAVGMAFHFLLKLVTFLKGRGARR